MTLKGVENFGRSFGRFCKIAARRFFVGRDVVKSSGPGPTAGFLFVSQQKGSEKMAFRRCARHFCCRLSEISMVIAEKNSGDPLNAGRRGPMDSAPCGMPAAES
jgi:hypothetical protein